MSVRRVASALLVAVVATLATLWSPRAPEASAAGCSGVWVVVGSSVRCAGSYSSGLAALRSAGFSVQTIGGGFVCRINGSPDTCTMNVPYWTYWHSTKRSDGTWGPWVYSAKGAGSYAPSKNVAEGWSYGSGSVQPGSKPPTVAPTATTTKPTATKTTTTRRPTTTSKPTTSRTSTTAKHTTTTKTTTTTATQPASSTTSKAPTPTGSAQPSPIVATAPAPDPDASTLAEQTGATAAPEAAPSAGTPVGVLATGGIVAVGGVALGAWALRRRP